LKQLGFAAPGTQSVSVKGIAPGMIQVRATLPPNTTSVTVSFSGASQSGPQSVLGGGGKPFTPVVLGKLGAPIKWSPSAKSGHDATLSVEATDASGAMTANLVIPDGTTDDTIYVQIANSGDSDGSYNDIALAFTAAAPSAPADAPPPDTGAPVRKTTTGCAAAGARELPAAFSGIGLAAAALAAGRRRSRRR
jgi:hypothetical protein